MGDTPGESPAMPHTNTAPGLDSVPAKQEENRVLAFIKPYNIAIYTGPAPSWAGNEFSVTICLPSRLILL